MVTTHKRPLAHPVSKMETLLGVDKRSLAVFRVLVGIVGLYDIIERWPDAKAHYSDEGIMPRSIVIDHYWNNGWFSFHLISGAVPFIKLTFILNLLVCFFVTIGYKTRLSMFMNWLFIISMQSRNNIVGHGGDVYMRVIVFFAIFVPTGAVWSIDSAFKRNVLRRENKKFATMSFASFAIITQVYFLYVFSYLHKTGDEWRVDYTATFFALQLDYFRTSFADILLQFPNFLKLMTFCVLYFEGYGPLLCMSPFWTAPLKTLGALLFLMMHIGFAVFMKLGIFSPICAAGSILLIPSYFWDRLTERVRSKERCDIHLYYNGRYGYIMAGLASTFLLLPDVEVGPAPIAMEEEATQCEDDGATKEEFVMPILNWVIVKDHKGIRHVGFKAFISILKASPIAWPLAKIMEIGAVQTNGKRLLDFIERITVKINEDILVTKPVSPMLSYDNSTYPDLSSMGPDEATTHYYRRLNRKVRFLKITRKALFNVIALFAIILALTWNCTTVDTGLPIALPEDYHWVVFFIRIDQMWSMFSPRPPSVHWWYTFEAELDDGSQTEIWNNQQLFHWKGNPAPYSRDKPNPYPDCIGNHRWFKIYENLNTGTGYEIVRLGMGRWVCREWNRLHPLDKRIHKFNIVYRNEKQNLDNTRTLLNDVVLWSHVCYDKQPPIV
eukprot:gene9234-10832_t